MRQSFPDIERRLAQNAADLRSRMAEMQKLRLAVKRGSVRSNGHRASPRVIAPSTKHARP
jgi:hypothetical protein